MHAEPHFGLFILRFKSKLPTVAGIGMQISVFARKSDFQEVTQIKGLLKAWSPKVFQYGETSRVGKSSREVVILFKPQLSEELIRVAAEVRILSPGCYLLVIGEGIPGMSMFHAQVNCVLQPSEVARLPEVIHELKSRLERITVDGASLALQELQEKNKELEKINFELDRFVYSASHDLRSPLTSVLGLLYLLREEVKAEGAQRYVSLMEESILKLDNIIRDIVAYSRNNRAGLQIEEIRLQELVTDVTPALRYLETGEISVNNCVKVEAESSISSDRNRLVTVLSNLISNSIKYRHPSRQPEIKLRLERNGQHLCLIISDNGIGIKEYHLEKIFDMFYRTSDHSTGSGLGLYIVRETIKKLGGTIRVESVVNQGTTFTITLPLAYA